MISTVQFHLPADYYIKLLNKFNDSFFVHQLHRPIKKATQEKGRETQNTKVALQKKNETKRKYSKSAQAAKRVDCQ